MKTPKENGLEVKVGLFVCIGLLIIGAMILEFGLGGKQGIFKKYYTLVVDLPDADGLLKHSQVVLGGASIGYVAEKPVLSNSLGTVRVILQVDERIKIPIRSIFKVSSTGLLGDKYVAVQTGTNFNPAVFNPNDPKQAYQPVDVTKPNPDLKVYDPAKDDPKNPTPELEYQPGEAILGLHTEGISDIAEEMGPAVKKLSDELDDVKAITKSLQDGVLSQSSQKDLQDTFANLKDFSGTTLPNIGKSAQSTMDKADQTMTTVHDAAENLRKTLETARDLFDRASHGEGLIGQLVNNRQLADNFNALVTNLKAHGILFYHDTTKSNPEPTPAPRDKRQH